MLKPLTIITLLQVLAAACDSDLKLTVVRNPPPSEEDCLSRPERVGCGDLLKAKMLKMEEAWPLNSFEGQVVNLKGSSFDEHLLLTIEGQEVPVFKTSTTQAFFLTPGFASPGLKTVLLKRRDRSHEFKIYILADTSIIPSSLSEPSQLCEGTEFMAADGSLALGSKACANMVSAVNCSEDGEVGCITTNSFTATDIKSAASKILAGEIVGGVEGKVSRSADLAPCTADGEVGCETTVLYKAALVMGAESKILAGQTVAGVSGNVTLPAVNKVLTGNSFGIAGTGVSGSLTLPSAQNVLAGSGTYGDTAALRTPTLTLPAAGKVLTATAYGVAGNGSTGTLILPAAGAVRSSAGAYGDPGSAVTGTIGDCAANGSACYLPTYVPTTQPLRAISYDAIDAGKASIRSSLTLAGITGTLADCADGDFACYVVGPSFKAAAVNAGTSDKILSGQSVAGVNGNVTLPLANRVLTGNSFGVAGTGLAGSLTLPAAANVLSGSGAYGNPSAPLTPAYSPDFPALAHVRASATVNGQAGTLADCSAANQSSCVATSVYKTMNLAVFGSDTGLTAANFNSTIKNAGNFEFWDAAGQRHSLAGDTDLALANVRTGITIFGVDGGLAGPPANCSSDGEANCLVDGGSFAAGAINGAASKILSGQTVAGVSGNIILPAASDVHSGTSFGVSGATPGTLTLPVANNVRASQGAFGRGGNSISPGLDDCAADGAINCVAVSTFKAAAMSSAIASHIKSGVTIAGTPGNLAGPPADCSSDGQVNCMAIAAYKAADMSQSVAGNIKSGVTIAGVSGNYPSATYPLPSASATLDLDNATFTARIKSSAAFEYWTSAGAYQTGAGDDDIQDFNIKSGVSIFGTTGFYSGPPAAPTGFVSTVASGTQINLTWNNSGASGYLLIARTGALVSFTPVDGTTYSSGAQGNEVNEVIIYAGAGTSYSHSSLTLGSTYHYALYAYNSAKNYSSAVTTSKTTTAINCGSSAGGTWVTVPGDSAYGTTEFCVMKYEAKNNGSNVATSAASGLPWTSISITQTDAIAKCSALGTGYHLITNDEWMTIAANIANTASNWSLGAVGSGSLNRGHSDNSPANALAASSDDNDACFGTGQTCNALTWDLQRRTFKLSTGEVVWDLSGNVWDWTSYNNASGKATTPATSAWTEYPSVGNGTQTTKAMLVPTMKSFWVNTWNSNQGLGQYYAGSDGSGGALRRGADWDHGTYAGVFSAGLHGSPSDSFSDFGFRCVRVASP